MKCSAVCWPDGPKREIQHRHSRYMKCINRESVNKDNAYVMYKLASSRGEVTGPYILGDRKTPQHFVSSAFFCLSLVLL